MRRSPRQLPTTPDQRRDARLADLERGKPRQGGPRDPNPITANAEPLRIIRGSINTTTPTITQGVGFTVLKNATGDVTVTFTVAFSAAPSISVAGDGSVADVVTPSASASRMRRYIANTGVLTDGVFHFAAIGPP